MNVRRGFTLVELAIVIVIVGFLTGGILVAQSMIHGVKINRLISDLKQYEIAVVQFQSRFNQYPGDSAYFIPPGNNNGTVDNGSFCAAAPNSSLSDSESNQTWAHMSQAKMLPKAYVPYSPGNCGGPHPGLIYTGGVISPYTELSGAAATSFGTKKYPIYTHKPSYQANFFFILTVDARDVLALESKLASQTVDYTHQQISLANRNGIANCKVTFMQPAVSCLGSTAVYGNLYYYLSPP